MTGIFSLSKPSHSSHNHSSSHPTPHHTFTETLMEDSLSNAQAIIKRLNLDDNSIKQNIFQDNREEAKQLLEAILDLQHAMQFVLKQSSSSHLLVPAQNLMQNTMKILQKEFHTILSRNRYFVDPEPKESSVSDEDEANSEDENAEIQAKFAEVSISEENEKVSEAVIADLKSIADCMIETGYGKECSKIYETNRKSVIDETLYYLGIENLSSSQVQKMEWEVLEKKIKIWLNAVKVAVSTLFNGEKILCDHVFSVSDNIRESCFSEIAKDSALSLFMFPEMVAKYKKLSLEKMFRILDLYDAVSELLSEIEFIFSFDSTAVVRSQALTAMTRLRESGRVLLSEFETAIRKDSSKVVPGGGVHPLSRYVMNYLIFLSDYSGPVSEIIADWASPAGSPLPESYLLSPIADDENSPSSAVSVKLAWLILVLLCKLDGKAGSYNDVALSYLFLANNLNYVVSKVRESSLRLLLGSGWVTTHEQKIAQYIGNYERIGWSKVMTSLPEDPTVEIAPAEAIECFAKFNSGFGEAYRKQSSWVIPDPKLRDGVKISLAQKIAQPYREFYEMYTGGEMESIVRFAPDDLQNYLSDLFYGTVGSENSSTTTSHGSSSHAHSTWSSPSYGR